MVRKRILSPIEKLEEAFRELFQQPPDRTPTKFEVVRTHQEWIGKLVERGHSYDSIAEAMTKKGVEISPHTLRQYFGRLERSGNQPVRVQLPKVKAARKAVGSVKPVVAVTNNVEADGQPRKVVEQRGRYKPILPGETEL